MVSLSHSFQEGNACANFLTKAGARYSLDFFLVHDPSLDLVPLLIADSIGTNFTSLFSFFSACNNYFLIVQKKLFFNKYL